MESYGLRIWSQFRLRRFLPFPKDNTAQRKVQTSVAATILEEILQHIFYFLLVYGSEDADPGFTFFGAHPTGRADLLNVARVCVHWNYAATPLIYTHCRARTTKSLERLRRTLMKSTELMSRVRIISNSKVVFPTSWIGWDFPTLMKDQKLEDALVRLLKTLPEKIELDMDVSASSVPRLVASLTTTGALLTGLHVSPEPFGPKGSPVPFREGMCFPHLRKLTLENYFFGNDFMWPVMPQLRSLRIQTCFLSEAAQGAFAGLPPLVKVEIIVANFPSGDCLDILAPGQLKTGIQDLVFFDTFNKLPMPTLFPSSTIRHYSSLRSLTLAAYGCPIAGIPLAPLSNLKILTIMQLHTHEAGHGSNDESPELELHSESLFKYLCSLLSPAHLTPSLKVVRIRCFSHLWNTADSAEFEEIARQRSLQLEVRTVDAANGGLPWLRNLRFC